MRQTAIPALMLVPVLTFLVMACEEREVDQPLMTDEAAVVAEPQMPDTTAEAVWAYMQEVDYEDNWQMWPGKTALYQGTEPHGALLTTYLNALAYDAVTNAAAVMPDSAFIIKENYAPDSTLASITVMYRIPGYDPEHNDWFWAKNGPDGAVEVAGRAAPCQSCHQGEQDGNYIMTGEL